MVVLEDGTTDDTQVEVSVDETHEQSFIRFITGRVDRGSGDRVLLRRCIAEIEYPAGVYRIVAPWAGSRWDRWGRDIHYQVAGLYARYGVARPKLNDDSDFGDFLSRCARQSGGGLENVEKALILLLDAERELVIERLIICMEQVGAAEVGIDWVRLMRDLTYWGEDVRRRWAENAWG